MFEPAISIVVPVYNEVENIPSFLESIQEVMRGVKKSYECILVDDGSTDGTREAILSVQKHNASIRLVVLRRNFGQTAAMAAGFDHVRGEIIITLDADGQNDPGDIPLLLQKLNAGYDLVCGWRKDRKDPLTKKIPSAFANALIAWVTGVKIHDSGCTLKAYRREVVKELNLYGQMHRFIPALASWSGVSLVEIPVRHHPRMKGKSKYGISRTLRVFLDLITVKFFLSYSTSPIQIFGRIGIYSAMTGFFLFAAALVLKFTQARTLTGNPLFYLFIFLELLSVQFILIGLLGEINIRTWHETRNKKTYVVKDVF